MIYLLSAIGILVFSLIFFPGYRARLILNLLESWGVDINKAIQYHYDVHGYYGGFYYNLIKTGYPHKFK